MNLFSIAIANEIFSNYPQWKSYAREELEKDGSAYLYIDVPAISAANTKHGITITTYDGEVTASFDCYHSHYDYWSVQELGMEHEAALPFVQGVLSETILVASWWQGDLCTCASQIAVGDIPEMNLPLSYDRIRIRSWKGTYNEDKKMS